MSIESQIKTIIIDDGGDGSMFAIRQIMLLLELDTETRFREGFKTTQGTTLKEESDK